VPYALLWAALSSALRFIPYVGPWVGAALPILVSLAAFPGWREAVWVAGLYAGLELITNLVLETVLYAGAAGVSQVALLVAVAFWTWLWGPLGLLMATPLTVCLVVLGKHVSGIEFVATLMADVPALAPDISYYQRLLARDPSEALDILERHTSTQPSESVFDALLLPALGYAERDRLEGRLSADEETAVADLTEELMDDTGEVGVALARAEQSSPAGDESLPVLAYPISPPGDELALRMLRRLLTGTGVTLNIAAGRMMTSDLISTLHKERFSAVCLADLPPSPSTKGRYLVKRLRAAFPDIPIVVGRWGPESLADDDPAALLRAGASHVGRTLTETRDYLCALGVGRTREVRPGSEPAMGRASTPCSTTAP
jgi:uncharacterized protein (DUF2384 family)